MIKLIFGIFGLAISIIALPFKLLGGGAPSTKVRNPSRKSDVQIPTQKKQDKGYEKCRVLLKRATQEKKQGHIDLAIQSLRDSYEIDRKYGGVLSTKDYVRLPKYLQIAGNYNECMNEMRRLTAFGTPLSKAGPSEFNTHMSDCYSAFAIIKKKQKISKYEIEADLMISNIYNLNFLHYSHQNQRREYIEIDLDPDDGTLNHIREREGFLRESAGDNVKLLTLINAEIKNMPKKKISVQEFYDCYSVSNA